jgi:hypothetical protein
MNGVLFAVTIGRTTLISDASAATIVVVSVLLALEDPRTEEASQSRGADSRATGAVQIRLEKAFRDRGKNWNGQAEIRTGSDPAKLVETSRTVITMAFLVMNAEKILRLLRLFLSILVSV